VCPHTIEVGAVVLQMSWVRPYIVPARGVLLSTLGGRTVKSLENSSSGDKNGVIFGPKHMDGGLTRPTIMTGRHGYNMWPIRSTIMIWIIRTAHSYVFEKVGQNSSV